MGKAGFLEKRILDNKSESKHGKLDLPNPLAQPPKCPECSSTRIWKDGLRYTRNGDVQRYLCRSCGHRFSDAQVQVHVFKERVELPDSMHNLRHLNTVNVSTSNVGLQNPALPVGEDVGSHAFTILGKTINTFLPYNRERQVCATERVAKNLSQQRTRTKKQAAGATETDTKSQLFNFAWWLNKEGYAESTITTRVKLLKILAKRGANLLDPESIKESIANQKWCNKRKVNAADAYTAFLRMNGGTWNPPRYKAVEKLPFIPTEAELDALISGCGPKTSTFLQLLKETGARSGEAHRLKWTDIDFEAGTVRITPEKGSKPRIFKLSNKLLSMILVLQKKSKPNHMFSKHLRTQRRLFAKQRANLARKLQNPRLLQIHFHTFRHWKATIEYHKTKDILHVMQILGHRSITNTLKYTQLVNFQNDDYTSKVAHTVEEACNLVEAGFEYVCDVDEAKIFRKRK